MSNTAMAKQDKNIQVLPQRAEQTSYFTPLVDVIETRDAFIFQADLPGVKQNDVDITFANGTLTIDAKVQPRWEGSAEYVWKEYGVGHFYRQFSLDTPVNADAIRAELKNGVLELHVPKAETAKCRRIEITSA